MMQQEIKSPVHWNIPIIADQQMIKGAIYIGHSLNNVKPLVEASYYLFTCCRCLKMNLKSGNLNFKPMTATF